MLLLLLLLCLLFACFLKEVVICLLNMGGIAMKGVLRVLIVKRVAANALGSTGGEHIASALRLLTGLQTLDLGGT